MLRTNANESIGYLNKRAEEKYDFYSVKTGYSFADLADCYNYLKNNNLSDLYAYIIANKLVKDCDVMINKKQNDALQYQLQIDSLTKNISKAKSIIDQFGDKTIEGAAVNSASTSNGREGSDASSTEIITDVVNGWDSNSIMANRDITTTYDKLIYHYADLQTELIDANINKGKTEEILSAYSGVTKDTDPESEEAKWASQRIEELAVQFTELYEIAIETIGEYNQIKGADNIAMKCSISVSEALNLKLFAMLAVVLFLIVGCFAAIFLGRLGDFIDYYLYVDKKTGLPNRERCDDMIDHYSTGKLAERFTFITLQIDLSKIGRSEGDEALKVIGENIQRVFRPLGFVGYNGAGHFMVMMENATADFSNSCMEHLNTLLLKSEIGVLEYRVYAGSANTTADDVYAIRDLIRTAIRRCAEAKQEQPRPGRFIIARESGEREGL